MNSIVIEYAEKLGDLGERIINISKKFNDMEKLNTPEQIKEKYEISLDAIKGYKDCKLALMLIVVPNQVQKEHKEIVEAIQMFIDGTEMMFSALDIERYSVDMDNIKQGLIMQEQGKERVVKLANQIAIKLS